jgi:DNA-3-methyladenine glycosylase
LISKPFGSTKQIVTPRGWAKLEAHFYQRDDVLKIAQELLGKILVTTFNNILTAARIVETEAYNGIIDKASHAFGNRRTNRTEVMYRNGGFAYVYLCYGIHHLFNVVTNIANVPNAVLIRAAEPVTGIEEMLLRTGKQKADYSITKGPGNVSRALGINTTHTGLSLLDDEIFIVSDGYNYVEGNIQRTARIGVDYAEEHALLPYRFIIKDSPYVSGKKLK